MIEAAIYANRCCVLGAGSKENGCMNEALTRGQHIRLADLDPCSYPVQAPGRSPTRSWQWWWE